MEDLEVLIERLRQVEKRIYERLDLEDKAFIQFKTDLDERLEKMNQLRTQILTERAIYVTWWTLLSVVGAAITIAISIATLIFKVVMVK